MPKATSRMEKRRFLIVDDDPATTTMLSAFLRGHGHDARSLTDSTKTMTWLTENDCDAVILDLAMPDIDGISLTRMIKARFANLPVVILTGWGYDDARMREALDAGAGGYVSKGVTVEEVYLVLQRVLAPKRHRSLQ